MCVTSLVWHDTFIKDSPMWLLPKQRIFHHKIISGQNLKKTYAGCPNAPYFCQPLLCFDGPCCWATVTRWTGQFFGWDSRRFQAGARGGGWAPAAYLTLSSLILITSEFLMTSCGCTVYCLAKDRGFCMLLHSRLFMESSHRFIHDIFTTQHVLFLLIHFHRGRYTWAVPVFCSHWRIDIYPFHQACLWFPLQDAMLLRYRVGVRQTNT